MMVLGVDPGFSSMGWAIVEIHGSVFTPVDCGVLVTEKGNRKVNVRASEDNIRRAQKLSEGLDSICAGYRPRVLATETMSWPRNAGVVAKMGIAWGVIATYAKYHQMPIVQASPVDIKKALVGDGKASKEMMIATIRKLYPSLELPRQETLQEHAADAVAAVWACMDSEVMKLWAASGTK